MKNPQKEEVETKKPKRKKRFAFILFLITVGSLSCWYFLSGGSLPDFFGSTRQGQVEYQVTYPDIDSENNMMAAGLPDKAVFKFKDEKSMTHLSAMMGLVTIDYIADRKENSAKQSLVLFNNKYVANLNEAAVNKLNAGFLKELKLVPGETKMIAGYKCEKAKAILENGKEVDVYYTRDLGGDEINFGNPYHEIKGVLMEFEIERYGISMKLQATKVAKEGVEEKDFTVPQDFKKMPIEELENILKTLNPIK